MAGEQQLWPASNRSRRLLVGPYHPFGTLCSKNTHMNHRAWMRLPSGSRLDLINPDPHAWTHADLATRLSRTARWGGESCWPVPLSVAQHSLLVLELRRAQSPTPLTTLDELQEVLHDAEEGFLGFDCISPLKQALGAPFAEVEARLSGAIAQRYGLPPWSEPAYASHKQADHTAAACEAVHCVGWQPVEVRTVLGISAEVLDDDPLARRYGDTPWMPWTPAVAAERFEAALLRLCRELDVA